MTAVRQPQQERSRATRERLVGACVDMLATQGWASATVAAVAEAAGVSRGAAQHHFPTRDSLIIAVMDQMFQTMTTAASEAATELPDDPAERVPIVVDRAVSVYTGLEFKAALQVWAAAASDPALAKAIRPLEAKLARAAHKLTVRGLDPRGENPDAHRLAQVTLDLARGLGLADTLSDDSRRRTQVIATWNEQLIAALS